MKELFNRISTDFDDSDGWIRIVDADWIAKDLRLNLSIHFNDVSESELWEIECEGVVDEFLCSEGTEVITFNGDSPLLKPYVEPEVELMFSENSLPPEFLLGVVCSCCIEIMGKPEFISRFMNMHPTIQGVGSSAYGLLGRFPESVAAHILMALNGHPIKVKAMPGRMPKRWTGTEHVSYPPLRVLEVGSSFVIAEHFSANRV